MEELLLVNPRKRSGHRKTRTAAQKRATQKLIAYNKSRRRRNPIAKKAAQKPARRPASKPVTYRRRRNPIGGSNVSAMLKNAFTGGVGAVTVNAMFNYLPIPAMMKTGYQAYAVKGAFAVALGMLGRRFLGNRAVKMAEGSMTVTMTQMLADLGSKAGLQLSGVSYYSPAIQYAPQESLSYDSGMGQYTDLQSPVMDYQTSDGSVSGYF